MSETKPQSIDDVDDHDAWRDRLLASLRECGKQPTPGWVFIRWVLAIVAGVATFAVMKLSDVILSQGGRDVPPAAMLGMYLIIGVFGVAILSRIYNTFLRNAWRSVARSAEAELSLVGSRRPVFYLRSFSADAVTDRTWLAWYFGSNSGKTVEQQMTLALRSLGPVIAIGRPGEKLPQLGAARFYVSDELWQKKVQEIVRESQLVVWMTGTSEGLGWEISHLTENIRPRRLLLWAHPHLLGGSASYREQQWRAFRDRLGKHFPKPLPERLGDARFFIFDNDWNPIPCPPKMSDVFTKQDWSALQRALSLRQNGCDQATAATLSDLSQNRRCQYFGDVIGARHVERDWPRLVAFALSLFFAGILVALVWRLEPLFARGVDIRLPPLSVMLFGEFAVALAQVVGLVAAYRWLKPSIAAIPVSSAIMAIAMWILRRNPLHLRCLNSLLQMGALAIAVSLSARLFIGLLVGKFVGSFLASPIFQLASLFREPDVPVEVLPQMWMERIYSSGSRWLMQSLLEAILFAVIFSLFLKALPRATKQVD